jgi:dipeptidyl-peptidase-4
LPYAYLLPDFAWAVATNLQRRGVEVQVLREDLQLEVESVCAGEAAERVKRENGKSAKGARRFAAGTYVVRTAQKEGPLAAELLESGNAPVEPAAVFRLRRETSLLTTDARPLPEKRTLRRPITFDTLYGGKPANFSGSPTRIQAWLKDGKHFLQSRAGRLYRVHAETGKAQPLVNSNAVFQALRRLELDAKTAAGICQRTRFDMNPDRTGALINHDNDLYLFRFDGSEAARLTHTPETEEVAAFSPNGKSVAFVRSNNLFVVDLATRTERALTTDGGGDLRNGKADWVYFEEINNRNWQAYWWSPDSTRLAFEQFNDAAVPTFYALNTIPLHGKLESTRHPKSGDPNPAVKLGVVSVTGGAVRWVDLGAYVPADLVISDAGWLPESDGVYFYAQNRIQTWLDFNVWRPASERTERWYREPSPAWIESPGLPRFLKNGDFVITSDRTGWNHLYRFDVK